MDAYRFPAPPTGDALDGAPDVAATCEVLWVTERGGRVKPAEINAQFVAYRDALGLPRALSSHSLWHSWVI